MSEADEGTSAATRRDVRRADEVLALAERLREEAAAFLDRLDQAIQDFRAEAVESGEECSDARG